jgi:hypothetical protein
MWRGFPASKPWKTSVFTPGKKCGTALLEVSTAIGANSRTASVEDSSVSPGCSSAPPGPSKNHAASCPRARIAACNGRRIASA